MKRATYLKSTPPVAVAGATILLEFTTPSGQITGVATKVSTEDITVSFNPDEKIDFSGLPFKNIPVYFDSILYERLSLVIDSTEHHPDTIDILMKPTDEKSSATLWALKYSLTKGLSPVDNGNHIRIKPEEIPRVPGRGLYSEDARIERVDFLRKNTPGKLENVEKNSFDPQKLTGNIESFIGSVEIPVGVAGPLLINGENTRGLIYSPLATSEGALVASVTRGAIAITRSGGVTAHVQGQRMLRVPLFVFSDMKSALFFVSWIRDHFHSIRETTRQFSNYAELTELDPFVIGKAVHVHFVYETGDAAGQNMTTTCTWNACLWILKQMEHFRNIRIENFMIEGNLSNDKKVTYQSFIKGRGIRAHAEAFISSDVLASVLKVTPDQMTRGWSGAVAGSVQAGMVGSNINVANIIAAVFTATGQDIASVHESSIAHFNIEPADDGIYISVLLPSLTIGTIGGGTSLTQQNECLEMLDCAGSGKAYRFAEIIASFALALELSTASAIAGGQFASAHERLGRNRPVNHLKHEEIDKDFLRTAMLSINPESDISVKEVLPVPAVTDLSNSILSQLTARNSHRLIGLFPCSATYTKNNEPEITESLMLKIKPTDREVIHMINSMGSLSDPRLSAEMKKADGQTGFRCSHTRELAIARISDERLTKYTPKTYGILQDDEREIYCILQEHLTGLILMDSADDVSRWNSGYIINAIEGISEIHSIWYGNTSDLQNTDWIGCCPDSELMTGFSRLWELLAVHANQEFPEWFSEEDLNLVRSIINDIPYWWSRIDRMEKTLIHNDFNPRNIAFRETQAGPLLCAYDWELATLHLPQHDLAELLCFVLDDTATVSDLKCFSTLHRKNLEKHTGREIDPDLWWEGFILSVKDFMINRLASYIMVHTLKHYGFMERVWQTTRHFAVLLENEEKLVTHRNILKETEKLSA